jgi:SsrA-binding protein
MAAKKKKDQPDEQIPNKIVSIARNRKARHHYEIIDTLECGIALVGSEVKSLRDHKVSLDESFARVQNGEVFLYKMDVAEYPQANILNHETKRTRKLLLKRREIAKFAEIAEQQGLTLVPLEIYFRRGIVKVVLAVARGKKLHDKRDDLKKKSDTREMRQAKLRRT